jgi:hypothetical protein
MTGRGFQISRPLCGWGKGRGDYAAGEKEKESGINYD